MKYKFNFETFFWRLAKQSEVSPLPFGWRMPVHRYAKYRNMLMKMSLKTGTEQRQRVISKLCMAREGSACDEKPTLNIFFFISALPHSRDLACCGFFPHPIINAYSYTYAASSLQFNFNSSWREIDVIQLESRRNDTTFYHTATHLILFCTIFWHITTTTTQKKPPTSNENIVNVATEIVVRRGKKGSIYQERKKCASSSLLVCLLYVVDIFRLTIM